MKDPFEMQIYIFLLLFRAESHYSHLSAIHNKVQALMHFNAFHLVHTKLINFIHCYTGIYLNESCCARVQF